MRILTECYHCFYSHHSEIQFTKRLGGQVPYFSNCRVQYRCWISGRLAINSNWKIGFLSRQYYALLTQYYNSNYSHNIELWNYSGFANVKIMFKPQGRNHHWKKSAKLAGHQNPARWQIWSYKVFVLSCSKAQWWPRWSSFKATGHFTINVMQC